jgi:hypothetical protein
MAGSHRPHLCIDRVVPRHHRITAMNHAARENRNNLPREMPEKRPGAYRHVARIAAEAGKVWAKGRTLGVAFLDGTTVQRNKVIEHATTWCDYANVSFTFNAGANAEIRISFRADPGSWSGIGTDCLVTEYFPKDEPTMNFGWLDDDTDDREYRRVVTHEFGHALGFIHEHSNPRGGVVWNTELVYKYFSGPPNNWSKDDILYNVIQKYQSSQLNGTSFDSKSIMLYSFPKELIKGPAAYRAICERENTKLSTSDKRFAGKLYPGKK